MNTDQQNFDIELVPRLCMMMGINKTTWRENEEMVIGHMPVSYYPYELSYSTYDKLCKAHRIWHELVTKVAATPEIVGQTLSKTIVKDEFMKRLYDIYLKTYDQN